VSSINSDVSHSYLQHPLLELLELLVCLSWTLSLLSACNCSETVYPYMRIAIWLK